MDEEGLIGTDFSVNVEVKTDLSLSAKSDNLEDTVDYVTISKIVQEEMSVRSKLIEHVAKRILDRLMLQFVSVEQSKVVVVKHKAPIQGDVQRVSVEMTASR
jgi:dihydroneopterin aldolase